MPKDSNKINGISASALRLSGKKASDTFKAGNNAGMLFKKDMKNANDIHDIRSAQQRLRVNEITSKTNDLRGYTPK
jgi:hypothetical protein